MVSEENIAELKRLAVQSCMASKTDEAPSIGRMLTWTTAQGKHTRGRIKKRIGALVDAAFDEDKDAMSAAKDALAAEIKVAQVSVTGTPIYRSEQAIRGLTDEIELNITRFADHHHKMIEAEQAAAVHLPEAKIDSATAVRDEPRSTLFGPAHPKIAPLSSLRSRRR